jgi:hypothetical protein
MGLEPAEHGCSSTFAICYLLFAICYLLLRNEPRASSAWPRFERGFRDSAQRFSAGAVESLNAHPLNDGTVETGKLLSIGVSG